MGKKREYVKLPITKEDINKTMMLHGDYEPIRFWENIIMSKVKHGILSNDRAELMWYMTGITDGRIKLRKGNIIMNKKIIALEDTVELMNSEDYRERFVAEYKQLVIRYKGLRNMLDKWNKGELNF